MPSAASVLGLGGCPCVLWNTQPLEADWIICWLGHLPCVKLHNKTLPSQSYLCSRALGEESWVMVTREENVRSWYTSKFSCPNFCKSVLPQYMCYSHQQLPVSQWSHIFFIEAVTPSVRLFVLLELDDNHYKKTLFVIQNNLSELI